MLFSDDSQSGLLHPFFSVVLESFKKEAEAAGYDITFISHRMGSGRVTYLDHCRYREVDGVCVACIDFEEEEARRLIESDLPLVTIDHEFAGRVCVQSSNADGMRLLLEYVYGMGHRQVGYIHGPSSATTDARLDSFRETARRLGVVQLTGYIDQAEYINPDSVYEAAKRMLSLPLRPTCILVCDDFSSTGALRAAREMGLRVPEDLSLAGYDGIAQMQAFSPRLTTVYQDAPRMGREAARLLIAQIEGRQVPGVLCVPTELIPGETVQRI